MIGEPQRRARPARSAPSEDDSSRATPPATRLSTDGEWWWNGAEWVPARTPDGIWNWDGSRWLCVLDGPVADTPVAQVLEDLADQRFSRAGELLAARPAEWPVPPDLEPAIASAGTAIARIAAIDRALESLDLQGGGQRLSAVFDRLAGVEDERERLMTERSALQEALRPELLRIGRAAPVPSFREADGFLVPAARLADLAQDVASATAGVVAAEAEYERRIAAARASVTAATEARDRAVSAAESEVAVAVAAHRRAVEESRARLAQARMPGPGALLASFGPVRLHQGTLVAGGAAGLTSGARAEVLTAQDILDRYPDTADRIFLLASSGAQDLHLAGCEDPQRPFLLVEAGAVTEVVECSGVEAEANRFAGHVVAACAAAEEALRTRRATLEEAGEQVRRVEADRSGIKSAEAALEAVRNDPSLNAAIAAAEAGYDSEQSRDGEVKAAAAELDALIATVRTAPPDLNGA